MGPSCLGRFESHSKLVMTSSHAVSQSQKQNGSRLPKPCWCLRSLLFPLGGARCLAGLVPGIASQFRPWRSEAKKEKISTPKHSYTDQCAKTTATATGPRKHLSQQEGDRPEGLTRKDLQPGRRIILFTLVGGQCSHTGKTNRGRRHRGTKLQPRRVKQARLYLGERAQSREANKQRHPAAQATEGEGTGDEFSCSQGTCSTKFT